jgi:hypothetical protein
MLAEVRALGEGLIIADQSPNKLAPDAMRNTNVQIAHQLRDGNDREAIANAMIMDEEQRDFIGKLETGMAAVFYTGLQKATFIQVPQYHPSKNDKLKSTPSDLKERFPGYGFLEDNEEVSDNELSDHMDSLTWEYRKVLLPFSGCEYCTSQCHYRQAVLSHLNDDLQTKFRRVHYLKKQDGVDRNVEMVKVCKLAASHIENPPSVDAAWCFLVHLTVMESPKYFPPQKARNSFMANFKA